MRDSFVFCPGLEALAAKCERLDGEAQQRRRDFTTRIKLATADKISQQQLFLYTVATCIKSRLQYAHGCNFHANRVIYWHPLRQLSEIHDEKC